MKELFIRENEDITLSEDDRKAINDLRKEFKSLPLHLEGERLVFDAYTIGSLRVGNTIINIESRNKCFTLNKVLQMMLYNQHVKADFDTTNFDPTNSLNGISVIPLVFLSSCAQLTKIGLAGGYKTTDEHSKIVKGRIEFRDFSIKKIPFDGVHCINDEYSIDILQNQIIKAALKKCLSIADINENVQINGLLKYFADVQELPGGTLPDDEQIMAFHSYNQKYPEVLHLALLILKELRLSSGGTTIPWYAFLTNSNDLFEEFARNLVKNTIKENVEKWEEPKAFASINYQSKTAYKSYVPDIMINYDQYTGKAQAIADAKNKAFNPETMLLPDLLSSEDLYQLLFYLRQAQTNNGALIYPTSQRFEPLEVNVSDQRDIRISLISVNLSSTIDEMEAKIKSDVISSLLSYT